MATTIRPFPRPWKWLLLALPVCGVMAGVSVWWFASADQAGAGIVLGSGLFSGSVALAAFAWLGLSDIRTFWVFSDEGFAGRLQGWPRRMGWDEVDTLTFGGQRSPLPGLGLNTYVVLTPANASLLSDSTIRIPVRLIHNPHITSQVLSELLARVPEQAIDPSIPVLSHFVREAMSLAVDAGAGGLRKAYERAGNLSLARAALALDRARSRGDLDRNGMVLLAEARTLMKQADRAISACDEILGEDDDNYWALLCKAVAEWERGEHDAACSILDGLAGREGPHQSIIRAFCQRQCER